MSDDRLPTALWIEAQCRLLTLQNKPFYFIQKGAHGSGMVLLKINRLDRFCRIFIQERDLDGVLGWVQPLGNEILEEPKADAYIARAASRDPDLWVLEIEDRMCENPFV